MFVEYVDEKVKEMVSRDYTVCLLLSTRLIRSKQLLKPPALYVLIIDTFKAKSLSFTLIRDLEWQ